MYRIYKKLHFTILYVQIPVNVEDNIPKSDKVVITGTVYDTERNNRTLPDMAIK